MLGEGVDAESIRGMMSTLDINELAGIVIRGSILGSLGGKGGRDCSLLVDRKTSFSIAGGGLGSLFTVIGWTIPRDPLVPGLCASAL